MHQRPLRLILAPSGLALLAMLSGCSSSDDGTGSRQQRADLGPSASPSAMPDMADGSAAHAPPTDELPALIASATLERAALVRAVLQRNPGIAAARAGWLAALSRYPQQSAWDDPMLSYRTYPRSIGAGVHYGQEIEISQRIPIGGKLDLQGEITLAEADAARADYQSVRLRLGMMASQLCDDYGLAVRSLAILSRQAQVLADLKASAQAHVANGTASIQDALMADAEAAELQQEVILATADRDVAITQLNGLLHRLPIDAPLPVPGDEAVATPGTASAALQEIAVRERPELSAVEARARRADSSLVLAERQYRPDVMVSGTYSSLWDQREYRYGLGVSVALPVHGDRLQGGIDEAHAQITQAHLEREHMERDIRVEVAEAIRRLTAAESIATVIHDQLLPALTNRSDAARTAFSANRASFEAIIAATRAQLSAELRYQQALTDVSRRRAMLIRAIGRLPIPAQAGATP